MAGYIVKKITLHASVCLCVCLLISRFSDRGNVYAGFAAAFFGAAFLLIGWNRLLRSKGTDITARLRRQTPPEAPYFHRNQKDNRPSLLPGKGKMTFDDSLEFEREEGLSALAPDVRLRADAIAFAICGVAALIASLLI